MHLSWYLHYYMKNVFKFSFSTSNEHHFAICIHFPMEIDINAEQNECRDFIFCQFIIFYRGTLRANKNIIPGVVNILIILQSDSEY